MLTLLVALSPVIVCVAALLCDRALGEPRHHPLAAFGNAACWLEGKLNHGSKKSRNRLLGGLAVVLLVGVPGLCVYMAQSWLSGSVPGVLFELLVLTVVIGWRSMKEHASAVSCPLESGNLPEAREKLSRIVTRETEGMEEEKVTSSVIESLLENANDCLFASLFWYGVFGPAGAVIHRLSNTLDAMWGYKTERFFDFGWAAARLDDLLGWIPARLTALCYALSGSFRNALQAVRNQAGKHKSPNGGLVMAAGAGALDVTIGGPVVYNGVPEDKIFLGVGERATPADIGRAIRLIERSIALWLAGYACALVIPWLLTTLLFA